MPRAARLRSRLTADELREAVRSMHVRYPEDRVPGFFQVPNELLRSGAARKVGYGALLLALLLKSYNRGDGRIFPPRAELAELLGVNVGTIDRWKKRLEKVGILTWRRGRTGRCNEYRVNFGPCREIRNRQKKNERSP